MMQPIQLPSIYSDCAVIAGDAMDRKPGDANLLTIAEIAKKYHLPESTARFYCKRFMDFLPHVGHGKRRRYRQDAIEVFEVILGEMQRSKSAAAVEETLAARFPRNIDIQPVGAQPFPQQQDSNNLPAPDSAQISGLGVFLQAQQQTMDRIADALVALSVRSSAGEADGELAERLKKSQEEVSLLRQEVERLKALQSQAELMHQQDLEQLRKWLGHLAREQSKGRGEVGGE